jgi:hypothetical protein
LCSNLRINHASESAGHFWANSLDFDEDAGTSAIDYAALDEVVNQPLDCLSGSILMLGFTPRSSHLKELSL